MAQLNVDLVAADRKIWSGRAQRVTAPAADGEIGILADRSRPLLSVLQEGSVRIAGEGESLWVRVSGGFLSVDSNQVTIAADSVESVPAR